MESRFNWNDLHFQDRKKKADDAYEKVKEKMGEIKKEIGKTKNVTADLLQTTLFGSNNKTMNGIYEQLCSYYNNNTSMWSNFKSMWKKLHKYQSCSVGESTDKKEIVVSAIVAATGSREYSRVKKGIIPELRLENEYESLCKELLKRENKLKSELSKGLTKVKTEDLSLGPILPKRVKY